MGSQIGLGSIDYSDELGQDLGRLLREQRRQESGGERDRGLDIFRSGSAPPTVEGSLNAVGGLFSHHGEVWSATQQSPSDNKRQISDEELRSDPAYINYYYSNVNLNPRLPPPLLSKEDWRFAQRVSGGGASGGGSMIGGIGDRRRISKGGVESGSAQLEYSGEEDDAADLKNDWNSNGLIGLPGLGLGSRQKSIAELIQDDLNYNTSFSRQPSRPTSRNAFDDGITASESQFSQLDHDISSAEGISASASLSYASALGGSLSRSATPDPQLIARAPSPRIPTAGEGRNSNHQSDAADIAVALSGMNLSGAADNQSMFNYHSAQSANGAKYNMGKSGSNVDRSNYYLRNDGHKLNGANSPSNYHSVGSPSSTIPNYSLSGHSINPALASMMASQLSSGNMLYENAAALGGGFSSEASLMAAAAELQNLNRAGNQVPLMDPLYLNYLRSTEYAAAQVASMSDSATDGGNSYMDLLALQKAYVGSLLGPQKLDCSSPYGKSGAFSPGYYGNQALGLGMAYGGNPLINSLLPNSPMGPSSPMRHGERNLRLASGMRNFGGGGMGVWRSDAGGIMDQCFASSLLDEFKSNKTKCFELSEIAGHVVEFSADQYGSRFIQQKLETATADEKTMVFHEIIPQALSLMTDVFGNYVIQKFFEHGTPAQIKELANKLTGHVLTLSLQMYGCRVIQKAIEVVDLDQQEKMVTELDGHIMRCVRDQNGNHVIQKCIECIPEDAIQFIVSTFYGQVVTLSTHPYGCRVIQRVLEHCHDPRTQQIVMDEIMQSICMLAQDQYGNYVVQHVLEHGRPDERTAIISKLTGKIIQMSQQKFASNVIEKCLTFGDPAERRAMVNEMLGSADENEPLQVMMKDQFGNYVVQKVLETCDDQQLEVILLRIKIHLNALKKYTYGKHIVARVEKLVAAGERRIGMQNPYPALAAAQ